jgi:hypothetical protein
LELPARNYIDEAWSIYGNSLESMTVTS